ncbi:uncharacterized protein TNCV_525491 [Trichonephila clavipes]|nr:uncharacterized protein TNCV_525491 [Trichonephila clavipes]
MSSNPVPLKTRRVGQRCTLNRSRAQTSSRWCGVEVRRRACQLRCRPRRLTMVKNYEVVKSFFTSVLASPAHLLDCWGIFLRQLYEEQDLKKSKNYATETPHVDSRYDYMLSLVSLASGLSKDDLTEENVQEKKVRDMWINFDTFLFN